MVAANQILRRELIESERENEELGEENILLKDTVEALQMDVRRLVRLNQASRQKNQELLEELEGCRSFQNYIDHRMERYCGIPQAEFGERYQRWVHARGAELERRELERREQEGRGL